MDKVGVLAALVVFRLFYLIIPLMIALIVVVLFFERSQFAAAPRCPSRRRRSETRCATRRLKAVRLDYLRAGGYKAGASRQAWPPSSAAPAAPAGE